MSSKKGNDEYIDLYSKMLKYGRILCFGSLNPEIRQETIEDHIRAINGCARVVIFWPKRPTKGDGGHHNGWCQVGFNDVAHKRTSARLFDSRMDNLRAALGQELKITDNASPKTWIDIRSIGFSRIRIPSPLAARTAGPVDRDKKRGRKPWVSFKPNVYHPSPEPAPSMPFQHAPTMSTLAQPAPALITPDQHAPALSTSAQSTPFQNVPTWPSHSSFKAINVPPESLSELALRTRVAAGSSPAAAPAQAPTTSSQNSFTPINAPTLSETAPYENAQRKGVVPAFSPTTPAAQTGARAVTRTTNDQTAHLWPTAHADVTRQRIRAPAMEDCDEPR
ncbi:hypothetical protein F5Y16DRAFT_389999 [Xylariaceae sp. FL0255]|nr:hypothetical protein F5Y16DRAFT_389999 [Xylariaceae sp. FL0255]